jgi:alpha-beta hydrolase superfamily lysophospholipase
MSQKLDLKIDVTHAAKLGEPAHVALTVHLPDAGQLPAEPIICFAKPGGGYSRGYYTVDLPGPAKGSQADWHAQRGWIFVSVDHLGVGDSSLHDAPKLDYTAVAAGSQAAEQEVLRRLAEGALAPGFPKIANPLKLGIGQSMGGCMTIIQQGRYHGYDGIGVLGYSAIHTHPPVRPGMAPIVSPWLPRDTLLSEPMVVVNAPGMAKAMAAAASAPSSTGAPPMGWGFHYDDVDPAIVAQDLGHFGAGVLNPKTGKLETNPWSSMTMPGAVARSCLTPGCVAPEAAAVLAPVLVAMGERDVIADPKGEPRAYLSAASVDLYICPHMGHMHNFASTRELFWRRIETWSDWVREVKANSPR